MPNTSTLKGSKRPRRTRRKQEKRARASNQGLGVHTQPRGLTARKVGRALGRSIGGLLGHPKAGGAIGDFGGKIFKSLTGVGDYSDASETSGFDVDSNTVIQPLTASQVPIFESFGQSDGTRVRHREYVRDIPSGTNALPFTTFYSLNPSNASLMPWCSGISKQYEQYAFLGAVFEFVSTAGTALAATQANMGDINIATQYNANAAPFNTKSELLNHFFSTSSATYEDQMHPLECNPLETPSLPRYTNVPLSKPNNDLRLNDWGVTTVYCTGSQSEYIIGQLWLTYDIVFFKQRLPTAVGTLYSVGILARLVERCREHPDSELAQLLSPSVISQLSRIPEPEEEKEDLLEQILTHVKQIVSQQDRTPPYLSGPGASPSSYTLVNHFGSKGPAS